MTINKAIEVLDSTIPPLDSNMMDSEHAEIVHAWAVIKTALPPDYVAQVDADNDIKTAFPIGVHVRALYEIESGVTVGMLGRVEGYLGGGRLAVFWHNAFRGDVHRDDVKVDEVQPPKDGE